MVRYISTDFTIGALLSRMTVLGYYATRYFMLGKLRVNTLHAQRVQWSRNLANEFLEFLSWYFAKVDKSDVVTIDSATTFLVHADEDTVHRFLSNCRRLADQLNKTFIVTVHPDVLSREMYTRISAVADGLIELSLAMSSSKLLRVMKIVKMPSQKFLGETVCAFEVEPHRGIRIVPYSVAKG